MNTPSFEDRLEWLGLLTGGFLALYGLAVLTTMPWTTNESGVASVIQAVGILLTIAIGLVLVYATAGESLRERLPGPNLE